MELEIVGESVRDGSNPKFTPSRLINLYSESSDGLRVLRNVLGTTHRDTIPGVNMQAIESVAGTAYAVQGGRLYSISSGYVPSDLASVDDSERTTIDGNNGAVTIAANGKYYVWNGTSISQPSNLTFSNVTDVVSFAQRTILVEGGGRRLQWSGLLAPATLDGLDFATTESGEDFNLRAIPQAGALWIFKEQSIEQWYATADGIAYIAGSKADIGLKGRNLVVKLPNAVFWVSSDGRARLSSAGIVSTIAVEEAIENGEPVRCVYYRERGNEFACIIFGDRPAWCFNLTTQEWHERRQGETWDVRGILAEYGSQIIVDTFGNLRTLDPVNVDADGALVRQIVTRTLEVEGRPFKVPKLEYRASTGEHNATLQTRISKDRARTFGPRRDYSFGPVGEYQTRIIMRALGQFQTMNLELTMSEPVDSILGATVFLDVAR